MIFKKYFIGFDLTDSVASIIILCFDLFADRDIKSEAHTSLAELVNDIDNEVGNEIEKEAENKDPHLPHE